MRHELAPQAPDYESNPELNYQIEPATLDYPIQTPEERAVPLEERPLAPLGDLVLMTVMGGALSGAVGTMSHAELLVLDGLGTVNQAAYKRAA